MPKTPSETSPEALPQLFTQMHAQTLDAMAALSQAGQRVMQELVELSTTAAKEGVRTCAELQSAALDAARELPAAQVPDADAAAALRQDPFAWYQKSLVGAADGAQRAFRLFETNAQIVARSAERFQSSAGRAGKEIQEALTSCMSRVRDAAGRS
jgi:hypothetical protein